MTTLIGSQEPRILNLPGDVVGSYAEDAIDLAAQCGLELDSWQKLSLDGMLSIKEDTYWNKYTDYWENKWAASTCGLVVARQNGKGGILEARELCGLFISGENYIIHSAHEHDTSQEAHVRLMTLIESNPDLDRRVLRAPMGHGEQGVELKPNGKGIRGPRMRFRTRTSGGGRGFTADLVVLDEAMKLESSFTGALVPTLSARPNPQLIYTGSAGNEKAHAFGKVRNQGISGNPEVFYAEWSADVCGLECPLDCDEHIDWRSEEAVAQSNPAYGIRIEDSSIRRERATLTEEEFKRERLSVSNWPKEESKWQVIPEGNWKARSNQYSDMIVEDGFVLAVSTAPNNSSTTIVAVGHNDVGDTHIEVTTDDEDVYDSKPGLGWVPGRVIDIWRRHQPNCRYVVVDKASPAGDIVEELEAAGIKVLYPNSREYAQSSVKFLSGIKPQRGEDAFITHFPSPPLNNAAMIAQSKKIADMWGWDPVASGGDITPIVAASQGVWGYKKFVYSAPTADLWVARG